MKHILNHDTGKLIDILKQMPQAVNTSYDPERHKANAIALLAESYYVGLKYDGSGREMKNEAFPIRCIKDSE